MIYPDKICPTCGNGFVPHRSNQIYCSPQCGERARSKREWQAKRERNKKVCRVCGKEFIPTTELKAYCSVKCQMERLVHRKRKCVCPWCGTEFWGRQGKVYCSVECQTEHYAASKRKTPITESPKKRQKKGEEELNGIITQASKENVSYGRFQALRYLEEHKYDIIKGEYV